MGFDYRHTCPTIDKSIERFKNDLKTTLIDLINECCPLVDGSNLRNLADKYVDIAYEADFSCHFEDVRKSNEDMREEAEAQIERLELQLEELKYELSQLEYEYKNNNM